MCICTPTYKPLFCHKCKDVWAESMRKGATTGREKRIAEQMITSAFAMHEEEQMPVTDLVTEAVRKDLLDRSTLGIKKYGTTLDRNSGDLRYWLNHAYEEALDHAQYLKRAMMEIDKTNGNPQA